jgi:serine/threonine-protein kinase
MIGTRLAHYEITAHLGSGGMGDVYQATDTKLSRSVAIKFLPDAFSHETERVARFQREARVLASLNHPCIAAIYGVEEIQGRHFLVMELVPGETLADRIKRGAIRIEEALPIATQIAEALEEAHEKGVVHRDLKPANVKLTPEGKVKVLDFGLAKAMGNSLAAKTLSNSPTMVSGTVAGVIQGTAAYMSPEQARGVAVDHRTDIWALGCVFYEMLTGKQAFEGELVSDILASVLAGDPDYAQIRQQLHPRLREMLRRCLEKNRKERWQAIGDVRVELQHVLADPTGLRASAVAAVPEPKQKLYGILPWAAAALILGALAGWLIKPQPPPEPRPVVRFSYEVQEGLRFDTGGPVMAFSPDGRNIVYNTARGLYVRSLDRLEARLVPGTEPSLAYPFFSSNGEWVGYYVATGELKKIPIAGGTAVTLCKATGLSGISWNADGTILFGQPPAGIMRVSSDGGEPKLVIPTTKELAYGPEMLPDGENVLFSVSVGEGLARWDRAQVVTQSLKSGKRKVLVQEGHDAHYASSGYLTYAVGNVLFAVPFDLKRLEVRGEPIPLIQDLQREAASASANYGFSNRGALMYLTGTPDIAATAGLALVDRNGVVKHLNVPPAQYRHLASLRTGKA